MAHFKRSRCGIYRLPTALVLLSLFVTPAQVVAAPPGPIDAASQGPVLEDTYAALSLGSGQTWYIYLQGHDLNEDMQYIWFEVTQLGGRNSTEIVNLRCVYRGSLYGYVAVYLPHVNTGWQTVRAEIKVKDAAGNYSTTRVHEVQLGAYAREAIPAKWQAAARNHIGNIFFDFSSERSHGRR